jgi:hypothetical protein
VKCKLVLLVFSFLILSSCAQASSQENASKWTEDFNYADIQQLQNAGWTISHAPGVSLQSGAVTLDGAQADTVISYRNLFQFAVSDWKVEAKGAWLGQGHSVLSVKAFTEKHSYVGFVDGYYNQFAFYRDDKQISRFGVYTETPNAYITLTLTLEGKNIPMYYNGHLEYTYSEEDGGSSVLTGVELISPWRGDARYDYVLAGEPNTEISQAGTLPPDTSGQSFPTATVLIGGGIAALVIGGVAVYYFLIAGGGGEGSGSGGVGDGTGGGSGQTSQQDSSLVQAQGNAQTQYQGQAQGQAAANYQDQSQGHAGGTYQVEPDPYDQAEGEAQAQYQNQAQGQAEVNYSQNQTQGHADGAYQTEQNLYQQAQGDAQAQYQQTNKTLKKLNANSQQENPDDASDDAKP